MRAEYERRLRARQSAADRHENQFRQLGNLRLATVLLGAVLAWYNYWLLPLPAAIFIVLLIIHDRVERKASAERRAITFYRRGLDRLEGKWIGTGESGERFRDPLHPYADDLDVFGHGSLFQLLCTARTAAGESILAGWLKQPSPKDDVASRQSAATELRAKLDLREDLALLGDDVRSGLHSEPLQKWGTGGARPVTAVQLWAARLIGAGSATTALLAFLGQLPWAPFLFFVLLALIYNGAVRRQVEHILHAAEMPSNDLGLLAQILRRMETEDFQSARLVELRRRLETSGLPPSRQISKLRRLIEMHDWTHNQAFAPIAFVLLWNPQVAFAIERWRVICGSKIGTWIQAVGEIEALCSLGAYSAEHPDDPFPELLVDGPLFHAEGLAHPLIPAESVVRNDLTLNPSTRLLLVSGSNMSGKSTLLRSVGLGVVMAWAGAPVRAHRLALSCLQTGASMRVNDSVLDGRSRFYAEITKLRQVVDLSSGPRPLLFLLDELLSGTNSHDRRIGAEAVVRSLVQRGALGLVTTHDLALAHIVEELGTAAANVHFEDHIESGQIAFDYKMKPGVVTKSNALELMRSIGLDV